MLLEIFFCGYILMLFAKPSWTMCFLGGWYIETTSSRGGKKNLPWKCVKIWLTVHLTFTFKNIYFVLPRVKCLFWPNCGLLYDVNQQCWSHYDSSSDIHIFKKNSKKSHFTYTATGIFMLIKLVLISKKIRNMALWGTIWFSKYAGCKIPFSRSKRLCNPSLANYLFSRGC